jgi:trehalose-phosphatase
MEHLSVKMPGIKKKLLASKACLLMLDFDGTLSPVASSSRKAQIIKPIKTALEKLVLRKNIAIAVISGRSLSDVKSKVGVKGLVYGANHGLEWEIKGRRFLAKIPDVFQQNLPGFHKQLTSLCRRYKGSFLEHKGLTVALHYRRVAKELHKAFKDQAALILQPYAEAKILNTINGKKIIDIRPNANWTKGNLALHLVDLFKKNRTRPLVIYIGDDVTDEDAFKFLKKDITVRVGKKNKSAAQYFVNSTSQVSGFLSEITSYCSRPALGSFNIHKRSTLGRRDAP